MLTRHSSRRISIFNHKGGVGKTTLTVNVAESLVKLGKRVLLVDSDPQCNLTGYLVEDGVVNDLLDTSDSPAGRTLWSAVRPLVEATGEAQPIKPIEITDGLYLLPGDVRLAEFEQELNSMWAETFQRKLKGFRGTTALSQLVNAVASAYAIDFVFYDSGPNIGPLNRVILLDSDYFIIPAACDLFSIRALKTLGHTMATWIRDWQTILELAPSDIYLLPGHPQLLGYIPQRFRVYGGSYTAAHAEMLPQIERGIHADVVRVLEAEDPSLVPYPMSLLKIGEVKDFGTLAVASQNEGRAISDVSVGSAEQRAAAAEAFKGISEAIVQRAK